MRPASVLAACNAARNEYEKNRSEARSIGELTGASTSRKIEALEEWINHHGNEREIELAISAGRLNRSVSSGRLFIQLGRGYDQ